MVSSAGHRVKGVGADRDVDAEYGPAVVLEPNFHPDTGVPGWVASTLTPPPLVLLVPSTILVVSMLLKSRTPRSFNILRSELRATGLGSIVADDKKLQSNPAESARAVRWLGRRSVRG